MKKSDFIKIVSEKTSMNRKDVDAVLKASLETIKDVLVSGDSITFMGFGTFDTVEREARETTLPNSKRRIKVPARKSVKFRVGKNLKEAVAKVPVKKKRGRKKGSVAKSK
ncbi:MAG TPA: HU family DNA-binding protein [Campylobacterales bacterium]|nr:HU family DNA-binding protein [Campylobacterales bacterium]